MRNHFARLAPVLALTLFAVPAGADPGAWSLGANFGVGTYSNSNLNDQLEADGIKAVKDGYEFGGTIRKGMSVKSSLELEGMTMNGKSTTEEGTSSLDVHTKGIAMPVNFLYALSQNDTHDFNLLVGAGPVLNMHGTFHAEDPSGSGDTETGSKTAFMAQGGFEGDYKVSTQFALSGRVLGRYAKASDVDVDKNDSSAGTFDIDHSGFAFSLGMRMFF
jgi:hypothetical protein